jgi:hypothetical protein
MARDRGNWTQLIRLAKDVSSEVIELSALSGPELQPLLDFLRQSDSIDNFEHVSVHGPSKEWTHGTRALVADLLTLPPAIAGIVMHPDSMGKASYYEPLAERLWIENMDTRKNDGRTVEELVPFFDVLPEARFCFDIAHAGLHDPTMGLAFELLDAFGDRLAEVHLSSIRPSGEHVRLREADFELFEPVLKRCAGVPWILEAPL